MAKQAERARPPAKDFLLEVDKGNIAGHSLVHKFGRNDAVASGVWEIVTILPTVTWALTTALTMRVKAGDVADTAAGAGAQEVTIEGLDETGKFASEAVATAGASASTATSTVGGNGKFIRVFRAYVSKVGSYTAPVNTAAVIIEDGGGVADRIQIAIAEGQTQHAMFTIPLGVTGYIHRISVTADGVKAADFRVFKRLDMLKTSTPFGAQRIMLHFNGILGHMSHQIAGALDPLPALTDIWVEGFGGGAQTEVSADFEILLVDN